MTADMIWMGLGLLALSAYPLMIFADVFGHPDPAPPRFQVLHPVQN